MSVSSAVQPKEMDFLPDHDHAGAVSPEFVPAFLNKSTGQVELSRWGNGEPASMHLIRFLPRDWAATLDSQGRVTKLLPSVVAGYARDGVFFTRTEAGL
jgi:hypothetical protein